MPKNSVCWKYTQFTETLAQTGYVNIVAVHFHKLSHMNHSIVITKGEK